jgi:hypothetical protein
VNGAVRSTRNRTFVSTWATTVRYTLLVRHATQAIGRKPMMMAGPFHGENA